LATTPIRIGSKLYVADIEPLLALLQPAKGVLDFLDSQSLSTLEPAVQESCIPYLLLHFAKAIVTDGIWY
jgi:hypothetical protein